jgi:pimeloyl-ACP methyl ester carboxylesterase
MGAGIALRFALAHPERVRALVLASFPRSADDPAHREWALGFAAALERVGLEAAGEEFAWGETARSDPKGAALIRRGFLEHSPRALAHTLRELLAVQPSVATLGPQLGAIRFPVLIVAGARDSRSLPASEALSAAIAGAQLEVIPAGGHVVNLTNPAEFNRALGDFMRSLPSAIDSK